MKKKWLESIKDIFLNFFVKLFNNLLRVIAVVFLLLYLLIPRHFSYEREIFMIEEGNKLDEKSDVYFGEDGNNNKLTIVEFEDKILDLIEDYSLKVRKKEISLSRKLSEKAKHSKIDKEVKQDILNNIHDVIERESISFFDLEEFYEKKFKIDKWYTPFNQISRYFFRKIINLTDRLTDFFSLLTPSFYWKNAISIFVKIILIKFLFFFLRYMNEVNIAEVLFDLPSRFQQMNRIERLIVYWKFFANFFFIFMENYIPILENFSWFIDKKNSWYNLRVNPFYYFLIFFSVELVFGLTKTFYSTFVASKINPWYSAINEVTKQRMKILLHSLFGVLLPLIIVAVTFRRSIFINGLLWLSLSNNLFSKFLDLCNYQDKKTLPQNNAFVFSK